ncbi:hypothetical protein ACQKP6_29350, partial [Pseudomonas fluorescens]
MRSCTGYPERLRKQQSQVVRHLNECSTECAVPNEDGNKHESSRVSANNIVSFNDHYASAAWNMLPFSILNVPTWISH